MNQRRFRPLRENDADPVTTLHAEPPQGERELVRAGAEFREGVLGDTAGIVLVDQRDA
jgi:hypothetical protein